MSLEALIFDVDGTLADTEPQGHRVAFNRAFDEAGLDWHWDVPLYGELLAVTGGKERMRHYVERYRPEQKELHDLDSMIPELHEAKTRHYTSMLQTGEIPLRPGVERLLHQAREAGLRLAIATTTTPANVEALLANTLGADWAEWFEIVGAGDIVPKKKPAPDIYEYVLQRMDIDPGRCLAFEDSHNGLLSSLAAGLPTIITINSYTSDQDFSGSLLVLNDMGEPERPFEVIAGKAVNGHQYLDVDMLHHLHKNL